MSLAPAAWQSTSCALSCSRSGSLVGHRVRSSRRGEAAFLELLPVPLRYTQAGHGADILHGASAKAKPVKTLDRLRCDLLIPAIPSQGTSTWSHRIGLSGCPGVPGWNGPRNRSGVQIV